MSNYHSGYFIGNLFSTDRIKFSCWERILQFLGRDNAYWALLFCFTVQNQSNYIEIRKLLNKTRLDILVDYHEYFQNNLENKHNSIDFITFVKIVNDIRGLSLSLISSEVRKINDKIKNIGNSDEIEDAYNSLFLILEDRKCNIVAEIQEKLKIIYNKYENIDADINEICCLELEKSYKYILEKANNYYRTYKKEDFFNKNSSINYYEIDLKSSHYRDCRVKKA